MQLDYSDTFCTCNDLVSFLKLSWVLGNLILKLTFLGHSGQAPQGQSNFKEH